MKTAAILCEYNPLHSGHRRHIEVTAALGYEGVVCVMSGNFVQRGDLAIYDKRSRARAAVEAGANLVVELPTACVLQSAQGYAMAGLKTMAALGASAISFGSECGDAELLRRASRILAGRLDAIRSDMSDGLSYPVAAQRALGELGYLLDGPNNTLGIEYCAAIDRLGLDIAPISIKREAGSERAGDIRALLCGGDDTHELIYLERAILARLRRLDPSYFAALPDVTEGLENRIYAAVRRETTLSGIIDSVSTKRYTKARIRRILLRAFLDLPRVQEISYLRVLALDDRGRGILRDASLPLITRAADGGLEVEARCTDIFALACKHPRPCGEEYTDKMFYLSR